MKKVNYIFLALITLTSTIAQADNFTWSSVETGGYVKVSGAVFSTDGTTIYLPTSTPNGDLVAIDLATGAVKWKYAITTVTYGGGALVHPTDGTIYQCGTDSKVYAVNPDGTLKWTASVDGVIGAFPALAGSGTFYCITNAGTLFALNASTGSEIWKKTIEGANTGSAVIVDGDGIVYAGTNKGLYAYSPDGILKWSNTDLNVTERGAMAINGNIVYVALKAGEGVAAVNIADGSVAWKAAANGDAYCPIIDKNGIIYFTEKGVSPNFNVYAINPSDGSQKWAKNIGAALTYDGLVLGDNGVVYGGTQTKAGGEYKVFGMDITNGDIVFEEMSATHQIMSGAAIGPDKRLYLGTITTNNIGYLNAYEINTGLETGSWSVRGGNMQGTNSVKKGGETSIANLQQQASLDVFLKGNILEVKGNADYTCSLYDLSGMKRVETYNKGIDISSLPNGVYIVKVKTVRGEMVRKIIL